MPGAQRCAVPDQTHACWPGLTSKSVAPCVSVEFSPLIPVTIKRSMFFLAQVPDISWPSMMRINARIHSHVFCIFQRREKQSVALS